MDDESLRSLIQEEVPDSLVDDVLQLMLATRRSYAAYDDVIGAYIASTQNNSEPDEQVLPTDMVILNKMLRRFGKHPDQMQ